MPLVVPSAGRGKSNSYVKRVIPEDAIVEETDPDTGIVTLSLKPDSSDEADAAMVVPDVNKPSVVPGSSRGPLAGPGSKSGVKRKHRFRSGTVALRDIRKAQASGDLLLARAPFRRVVREVAAELRGMNDDLRFQEDAMDALQEALEQYTIDLFQVTNKLAIHSGRPSILLRDFQLAVDIRKSGRGGYST
jgi:histone H3/H4